MVAIVIIALVSGFAAGIIIKCIDLFDAVWANLLIGAGAGFIVTELVLVTSPGEKVQLGVIIVGAIVLVFSSAGSALGLVAQHFYSKASYTFPGVADGVMEYSTGDGKGGETTSDTGGGGDTEKDKPVTATSVLVDTAPVIRRKPVVPKLPDTCDNGDDAIMNPSSDST